MGKKMKKLWRVLLPVLIVVGAVFLLKFMTSLKPPAEKKAPEEIAMAVEVVPVEVESLHFTVTSQGTVQPRTQTVLVAEVSGKIQWVAPELIAGGLVERGQDLLRIDPSDYLVAVKRAEAALAGRVAQLAQERARAEQAVKDWEKLDSRRGTAAPDLVLRKPQLAEAEANVKAAEADLEKAQRDLERTRIVVPYDGLVRSKLADIGQYVTLGTQLGEVFAVDLAEVRLPLSGPDLKFLSLPGFPDPHRSGTAPVTLSGVVAGEEQSWEAEIVRTERVVDERTRVVHAVAQVRDPYGLHAESPAPALPIGTFVRAEITGDWIDEVVVLPRHTLRNQDQVLIANAEDRLEIRRVELLRAGDENVYVAAGLKPKERVVTTAIETPIPGTRLKLGDTESAGSAEGDDDEADRIASAGEPES